MISTKNELAKDLYDLKAIKPKIVNVPSVNYLAIKAGGNPQGTDAFSKPATILEEAYKSLALKNKIKAKPLIEAIWYGQDESKFEFDFHDLDSWNYTIMIYLPFDVTKAELELVCNELSLSNNQPLYNEIFIKKYDEGKCMQVVHKGDFEKYQDSLDIVFDAIQKEGKKQSGYYHEIYMSDISTVGTKDMVVIIRFPMK